MRVDAHPGLHVFLFVGRKRDMKEYDDNTNDHDEDDPNTATKYVETIPGVAFGIHRMSEQSFHSQDARDLVLMDIYLDGVYVDSIHGNRDPANEMTKGVTRQVGGNWLFWRYKFSDNPNAEVKIECYWVRIDRKTSRQSGAQQQPEMAHALQQPKREDGVTGRAASTTDLIHSLALPKTSKPTSYDWFEYPYSESPFATFIFKCRTRGGLTREGIIPSVIQLDAEKLTAKGLRKAFELAQDCLRSRVGFVDKGGELTNSAHASTRRRSKRVSNGNGEVSLIHLDANNLPLKDLRDALSRAQTWLKIKKEEEEEEDSGVGFLDSGDNSLTEKKRTSTERKRKRI